MKKNSHAFWVEFVSPDIILQENGAFSLCLSQNIASEAGHVTLIVDVYDLDNHVHPEGHIGWWQFPVENLKQNIQGKIIFNQGVMEISLADILLQNSWVNDRLINYRRLVVSAVIRSSATDINLAVDKIPAFKTEEDRIAFRSTTYRQWESASFANCIFLLPSDSTIRIVARNIFFQDAVGNLCLDIYRLLRKNNISVELYAENFNLETNDIIRHYRRLSDDLDTRDQLLYFFSIYDPVINELNALSCARKIAYFHGITAPSMLHTFDPELATACQKGIDQIPQLQYFDVLAANSAFNAFILSKHLASENWGMEKIHVIPPKLIGKSKNIPKRLFEEEGAKLLYVGRIKEHKKIEHLLYLFSEYLKYDSMAECWIVGGHADKLYWEYLNSVETQQLHIPQGKVHWLGNVNELQLTAFYASASIYVSMSEDEGFCLPVFEAMLAKLPVFVYGIPAVLEVLQGTGVCFTHKNFVALAEELYILFKDKNRLKDIITHQYERASVLAKEMDGSKFLALFELPTSPQHCML